MDSTVRESCCIRKCRLEEWFIFWLMSNPFFESLMWSFLFFLTLLTDNLFFVEFEGVIDYFDLEISLNVWNLAYISTCPLDTATKLWDVAWNSANNLYSCSSKFLFPLEISWSLSRTCKSNRFNRQIAIFNVNHWKPSTFSDKVI